MFASRQEAGRLLGERLREFSLIRPVVLGITRGGVAVAAEVAKALKAPLYPLVIKKVSSPLNPEFAIGAVSPADDSDEVRKLMRFLGITDQELGQMIKNKTAIIVDDGVATGWTLRAAIAYARGKQPNKIVVAVPVADPEIVRRLEKKVDRLVVLEEVDGLGAVGNFYENFAQVSDAQVKSCVEKMRIGE